MAREQARHASKHLGDDFGEHEASALMQLRYSEEGLQHAKPRRVGDESNGDPARAGWRAHGVGGRSWQRWEVGNGAPLVPCAARCRQGGDGVPRDIQMDGVEARCSQSWRGLMQLQNGEPSISKLRQASIPHAVFDTHRHLGVVAVALLMHDDILV